MCEHHDDDKVSGRALATGIPAQYGTGRRRCTRAGRGRRAEGRCRATATAGAGRPGLGGRTPTARDSRSSSRLTPSTCSTLTVVPRPTCDGSLRNCCGHQAAAEEGVGAHSTSSSRGTGCHSPGRGQARPAVPGTTRCRRRARRLRQIRDIRRQRGARLRAGTGGAGQPAAPGRAAVHAGHLVRPSRTRRRFWSPAVNRRLGDQNRVTRDAIRRSMIAASPPPEPAVGRGFIWYSIDVRR
jgi:hypothetical protein